jgi:hypothetical protein
MIESEKNNNTKKLTCAPIYQENPFVDNMLGELKFKHKTQMIKSSNNDTSVFLVNGDGDSVGHSAFMRNIEVDEEKFAKIYISQLGALWNLKKTSLKVLSYILSVLKANDDRIYFDIKNCLKYCDWNRTQSVYNGLIELINAKIIARTNRIHFYYINPSVVFNGNRVTFINTYVKKKKNELPDKKGLENNIDFIK